MNEVIKFLEENTSGTSYKSYKYCFENIEVPSITYDDKQNIVFSKDRIGETDRTVFKWKSIENLSHRIKKLNNPLFRFYLDGSRRTYKIDDFAYGARLYPIMAGQIGVGVCERKSASEFKKIILEKHIVLSLPSCADKDDMGDLFFNRKVEELNQLHGLKKRNFKVSKILPYEDKPLKEGEKYEHKGIIKIQNQMIDFEKKVVKTLVQERRLNVESYLLKDGSLEYSEKGTIKDFKLSSLKSNYQCVVGVSKSFNPELCKDRNNKSIAKDIADLPLFYRTPAYKYRTEIIKDVEFSLWYLRIREAKRTVSPFEGIIKVEKILVSDKELEKGLSSDEIDRISANLINERNVTCYGSDSRWANHLYPVFLTESFIKSHYISDTYFLNIF